MIEIWKPVVGYEDLYEVSDRGRFRTVGRFVTNARWGGGSRRWIKPKLRKLSVYKMGYTYISVLDRAGKLTKIKGHRAVLEAFRGPCPTGMESCHRDGRPGNNYLDNLRWGTKATNNADKIGHGTDPSGERNPAARLTVADVAAIRAKIGSLTLAALAAEYRVHLATIHDIKSGRSWTAGSRIL